MTEVLANGNFGQSLSKIGSSVGPYLGALASVVGVIMAFIPSESAELAFMKNMMKNIDNRLDQVDNRFNDIERLINWNVVRVNFWQIQQKINVASDEFQHIYTVPEAAFRNRTQLFIDSYDSDYQNSGKKLYDAIVNNQNIFQDNLGTSIMLYTKYDRRKTQIFLLGVMKLLLKAVTVELGFLQIKQYNRNVDYMKSQWQIRIQQVRRKFEDFDQQCVSNYQSQSGKDIDEYSPQHSWQSNSQFATGLFRLLAKKYYWRDWIVIAYNPIRGSGTHYVKVRGGHIKFRKNGRNIVVASVDENHPVMNLAYARWGMNDVSMTTHNFWKGDVRRSAKDIYEDIDRNDAALCSVIRSYNNANYHYHSKRAV
ncbi:uncharacterized protein [Mytilus edulis]|uniref:uncharacterized protein n=1 Tax=Mytilus edulis TaxID=6550 RepID=UPI0039F1205E